MVRKKGGNGDDEMGRELVPIAPVIYDPRKMARM
jgi:hypothetical protein